MSDSIEVCAWPQTHAQRAASRALISPPFSGSFSPLLKLLPLQIRFVFCLFLRDGLHLILCGKSRGFGTLLATTNIYGLVAVGTEYGFAVASIDQLGHAAGEAQVQKPAAVAMNVELACSNSHANFQPGILKVRACGIVRCGCRVCLLSMGPGM